MHDVNAIAAALDLEDGSDAVLARAAQLAAEHAARLVVFHVVEAEPLARAAAVLGLSEDGLREALERQALATLEALVGERAPSRGPDVCVAFGAPYDVIARAARERSAGLLVIGPGKRRSLKEWLWGSTADRVLRVSRTPVLVVRNRAVAPYRRVVVGVDFSEPSANALEEAVKLAPNAHVEAVHALDMPPAFEHGLLRAGATPAQMDEYRREAVDRARIDLDAFVRAVVKGDNVETRVLQCEPGLALVRLSEEPGVDLLAVGVEGRGAVLNALLGSVAHCVVRQSACDVLVVGGS